MSIMDFKTSIQRHGVAVIDITAEIIKGLSPNAGEGHAIILLCTAGEAWAEYNMELIHIVPHSRVSMAQLRLSTYSRVSPDFEAIVVVVDNTLSLDAAVGISSDLLQLVIECSVSVIDDEGDWNFLLSLTTALRRHCAVDPLVTAKPLSVLLVRSFLLAMAGMAMRNEDKRKPAVYGQGDKYFRQFVTDVLNNVTEQHEVNYYAARLCITPKYLSDVCKVKSNRTAKEIISSILVAKLKHEILTSGKSLKEIASDFHFADQSSLGKFFRKEVGVSPAAFKVNTTAE